MTETQVPTGEEFVDAFIAAYKARTIARQEGAYNLNRGNPQLKKVIERLTSDVPESIDDISDEFAKFIGLEVLTAAFNDAQESRRLEGLVRSAAEASEELERSRKSLLGKVLIVTAIGDHPSSRAVLSPRKLWVHGGMVGGAEVPPSTAKGTLSDLATSETTFVLERHRLDRATGLGQFVGVEPFYVPDESKPLEVVRNVTIELGSKDWE